MKQIHFLIEAILAIAIIALFFMHLQTKKVSQQQLEKAPIVQKASPSNQMSIAYINEDSLLLKYQFAIDMNDKLLRKQESSRATINQKGKKLEADVKEFYRKLQNNGFLSQARAKKEEQRLTKKQQELKQLEIKLTNDYSKELMTMNNMLRDSVNSIVKLYNKKKQIHIILTNSHKDNVMFAKKQYDITTDIVSILNKRYKKKN